MTAQNNSVGRKESFINHPPEYKPLPFWHLNGKHSTAEIEKKIGIIE
jgi:hypothetical protein